MTIPVGLISRDTITQVARFLYGDKLELTGDAAVIWDILQTEKQTDRLHKRVLARSQRWLVWDCLTSLSLYLHQHPNMVTPHVQSLVANMELWLSDPTVKQQRICDQYFYDAIDPDDDEPASVEILIENTLSAMGRYGVAFAMSATAHSAQEAGAHSEDVENGERELALLRGRLYSQFTKLLPDDPPPVLFPTLTGPESVS